MTWNSGVPSDNYHFFPNWGKGHQLDPLFLLCILSISTGLCERFPKEGHFLELVDYAVHIFTGRNLVGLLSNRPLDSVELFFVGILLVPVSFLVQVTALSTSLLNHIVKIIDGGVVVSDHGGLTEIDNKRSERSFDLGIFGRDALEIPLHTLFMKDWNRRSNIASISFGLNARHGALNWSWSERAIIEDYVSRTSRYKSNPVRNNLMYLNEKGEREEPTRWTKKKLLVRPKVAGERNDFATAAIWDHNRQQVLNANGEPRTLQLIAVKLSTRPHGYPGGKP
ncbi:hypothetical protein ASPZODRAFT_147660 [Penicilliopsis zonata CBS 506.65]|uniref:Uncharacterized protein n=1 Tax=Penicilliopsis zonata CBS 506.65 TaxID=1073090 RepID=A0A1L9S4Z1_9EURO|nr:hypothetical protein ASPZODRAFT_147660 [Penicilliopsis zonata CBS 506.65]OJJ42227.1 hypothetical protein ASPZODRAFT_147660 [Penicilliopsis zonata CBS 506.65]